MGSRVAITRKVFVESFDRKFAVPQNVDWSGIDAWFDQGQSILFISILKLFSADDEKEFNNLTGEKARTKELPEHKEPRLKDGKTPLETSRGAMETKHSARSQVTTEEIQTKEQQELKGRKEKPAAVQMHEESRAAEELNEQWLYEFKKHEDGQENDQDIKVSKTRQTIEHRELSLEPEAEKTNKPPIKAPKEEKQVKPESEQPEGREEQEQEMATALSREMTTKKLKSQRPNEPCQKHDVETQEHDKLTAASTYEKSESVRLMEENQESALHAPKVNKNHSRMIASMETIKIRKSQPLHQEQTKNTQLTKQEELEKDEQEEEKEDAKRQLHQQEENEPLVRSKSAQHPPYKIDNTTQSATPKEADKQQSPKVRETVQALIAAPIQSEEPQEQLQQHKQEAEELEERTVVPTCEMPGATALDQVLEDEHCQSERLKKKFQQHEQELQKQEETTIGPKCEKPNLGEHAEKGDQKIQLYEHQQDKKPQRMGFEKVAFPTKKTFQQEKESQLQLDQGIMKLTVDKSAGEEQNRLQEAAEPTQLKNKTPISTHGQVLVAPQHIQSELHDQLKHKKQDAPVDKEPTVAPASEIPNAADLQQNEEQKVHSHENHKSEEHRWESSNRDASKTRVLQDVKIHEEFKQGDEENKQNDEKPIDKVYKHPVEVGKPKILEGEKEAIAGVKQEIVQEENECNKPIIQPHNKKVAAIIFTEPTKREKIQSEDTKQDLSMLEGAPQIRSEDMKQKLEKHQEEVQENGRLISPYEKPKDAGLMDKEELKQMFHQLKEDENAKKVKHKLNQPEQENLECRKPTRSPSEIYNATQLPESKEIDHRHRLDARRLIKEQQAAQVQSKNHDQLQHQEQGVQEHIKPEVVPTFEKSQSIPSNQPTEEHFEKKFQQHECETKKQEKSTTLVPACGKDNQGKEEPKLELKEFQEDKKPQGIGPDIDTFLTKKLLNLEEESSLLLQENKVLKQEPEKPIRKAYNALQEAGEQTQPENAENDVENKEAQAKMSVGKPTYMNKIENEFQDTAEESHDIESVVKSQEKIKPDKQLPKPMEEQIVSNEHHKPATGTPSKILHTAAFISPKILELDTPKAPITEGVPQMQEIYPFKELKQFEMPPFGSPSKALDIKEQRPPPLEQEHGIENKATSPKSHQRKKKTELQREMKSIDLNYKEEIEKERQPKTDERFKHAIIMNSPEKKLTNEIQKPKFEKEMDESMILKQKMLQTEEGKGSTSQGFSTMKKTESKSVLQVQESDYDQQLIYKKPAEESSCQSSAVANLIRPEKEQESEKKDALSNKRVEPGNTGGKEQLRERIRKPTNREEETPPLEPDAKKVKIPITGMLKIIWAPEPEESNKKPEKSLQFKPPKKVEAQVKVYLIVEAEQPDIPAVDKTKRESQTNELEKSTTRKQPLKGKQLKEIAPPEIQQSIEEKKKEQSILDLAEQLKQLKKEAHKIVSAADQELARQGVVLEPQDIAERKEHFVETVPKQKSNNLNEEKHDIESPKLQKPPLFPIELEDKIVPERYKIAVQQHKLPPRTQGATKLGSLLPLSPENDAIEHERPSMIQTELQPNSDPQKHNEQNTAGRQTPEYEESTALQEGQTNEKLAPHKEHEEKDRPVENAPRKVSDVSQQPKICELEHQHYPHKEIEEEENHPAAHASITEKAASCDEGATSVVEMNKYTKVKKLRTTCCTNFQCCGSRPAFPISPSTLLSGSAFVFSAMVVVFHFLKRKT